MSGTVKPPRKTLISGALGAGVFALLFVYSLIGHGGFSVLGVEDARLAVVIGLLKTYFPARIGLYVAWLLALHLLFGFFLGLCAAFLTRRAWLRIVLIVAVHTFLYLRQMILTPQLFADLWLGKGGARAAFQIFLTSHVSPIIPAIPVALFFLAAAAGAVASIESWKKRIAVVLACGTMVAAWFLAEAFPASPITPAPGGRPNIILLALDSLRPDRLSAAGYKRDTSPNLDALIAQGSFFTNVYAQIPRTFPSWVSILTGVSPPRHGVRSMFPTFSDRAYLPPTVVGALRQNGYRTAVISDFAGDIFPRIELGFEDVRAPYFNLPTLAELRLAELMTNLMPYLDNVWGRKALPILREFVQAADAKILTDESIDWIGKARGGRPFFLTVFYSTTHFPFAAPYPYYNRYADPDYRGAYRYHKYSIVGRKESVTDADRVQVGALYDGALRATDEQVGRLVKFLDGSGLARNTVVMVIGDHGEDLYETPDIPVEHGAQLRTEFSMKTGMILRGPAVPAGRRFAQRIRLMDVAPTLAALAGVPFACPEGRDAGALIRGEESAGRPVYSETGLWYDTHGGGFYNTLRIPYPDVTKILAPDKDGNFEIVLQEKWKDLTNYAKHRAWIEGDWKLVKMPLIDGVRYELYNLPSDPLCLRDLSETEPEKVRLLADRLERYLAEVKP